MDFNKKLNEMEQNLYTKYPHLQPQQMQQAPITQETQQEQQQRFNVQIESEKRRMCDILIDWNNHNYERLSLTFVIDSLVDILKLPLHAQDQIYYKEQLIKLENAIRPKPVEHTPPDFKSAEELVNNSDVGNNENK